MSLNPHTIYWPGITVFGKTPKRVLGADQVEAIQRAVEEITHPEGTMSVLVGAELGSGKTVVVTEIILELLDQMQDDARVLIIGPRDVARQWFDTITAQSAGREVAPPPMYRIDTTKPGAANLDNLMSGTVPGVYYAGLELLRSRGADGLYKSMPEVDLIVTDEAHRHSSRASQGIKVMRTIPAVRKIALSGTFFGNKFENAHTITRWLWPEVRREDGYWLIDPSQAMWLARWGRVTLVKSKAGRTVLNPRSRRPLTKVVGEKNPGEFVKTLPCYIYLKSPVGDPPPPVRYVVPMSGIQESQYRDMENQALAWLVSETGTLEPLVADLPIIQRMRLRTAALGEMRLVPGFEEDPDSVEFAPGARSNKLNALGNLLMKDPDWVGERVLILTHSKVFGEEVVRRIERKFPGQVAQKTGQTKEREWDGIKERFMRPLTGGPDDLLYLVATHSAVGTGTDGLQFECSRVAWLSRSENNTDNMQSAQRIWRRGVRMDQYRAVEFISEGTLDEEIEERTNEHREMILASIRGGQ